MFSQTSEYALRTIVYLASNQGQPAITEDIAKATRVPRGYLSKVLQTLGRAGLVTSHRGLHGGFVLTHAPQTISVLDVINAVDPLQRIETCPLGIKSHGKKLCPLHRRMDDALAQVEKAFAESTIATLLSETTTSKPLCSEENTATRKKPAQPRAPIQIGPVARPNNRSIR